MTRIYGLGNLTWATLFRENFESKLSAKGWSILLFEFNDHRNEDADNNGLFDQGKEITHYALYPEEIADVFSFDSDDFESEYPSFEHFKQKLVNDDKIKQEFLTPKFAFYDEAQEILHNLVPDEDDVEKFEEPKGLLDDIIEDERQAKFCQEHPYVAPEDVLKRFQASKNPNTITNCIAMGLSLKLKTMVAFYDDNIYDDYCIRIAFKPTETIRDSDAFLTSLTRKLSDWLRLKKVIE